MGIFPHVSRHYHVRPLAESEFARAYPLIRAIATGLSLNAWLGFARLFAVSEASLEGGIISAQDDNAYIYGLCCYMVLPNLCHRRSLIVEPIVALHVVDPLGPIEALLEALEPIAHRLGCESIQLVLPRSGSSEPGSGDPSYDVFRAAGYELGGIKLSRRLAQPRPA